MQSKKLEDLDDDIIDFRLSGEHIFVITKCVFFVLNNIGKIVKRLEIPRNMQFRHIVPWNKEEKCTVINETGSVWVIDTLKE